MQLTQGANKDKEYTLSLEPRAVSRGSVPSQGEQQRCRCDVSFLRGACEPPVRKGGSEQTFHLPTPHCGAADHPPDQCSDLILRTNPRQNVVTAQELKPPRSTFSRFTPIPTLAHQPGAHQTARASARQFKSCGATSMQAVSDLTLAPPS